MTEVISIKFRGRGKAYYFDPAGITAKAGDTLVVETSKGMELGDCVKGNHMVEDSDCVQPLRPVVRRATPDDLRIAELNRKREKEALGICRELIEKHKLEMKLVDVECSFEGNKILFFFTADGRVDFRELVKDLAGVFRTRIELRQLEYCEVIHRTIFFHLTNGTVLESTGSLDELSRQLQPYGCFLRVHRSYLINLDHVQGISYRSVTMKNEAEIPLPRGRYQETKEAYLEYAFQNRQVMV